MIFFETLGNAITDVAQLPAHDRAAGRNPCGLA
jgi:hypothetical protein